MEASRHRGNETLEPSAVEVEDHVGDAKRVHARRDIIQWATRAPPPPTSFRVRLVTQRPADDVAPKANRRLASLGLVAVSLVISGVLLEIALRLLEPLGVQVAAQIGRRDPRAVLIEPHGDLGYRQRANAVLHYQNGTTATANLESYRGPVVTRPKPPKTFRIILLGESTTHGWGVNDGETIDAYLRAILQNSVANSGWKVEVLNLAYDGYDAYQILERLKSDGIPRQPDLIIVNTGINDVRSAKLEGLVERDGRTLIWEAELSRIRAERERGGPTLWVQVKHWSYLARLPSVVRQRQRVAVDPGLAVQPVVFPEAASIFVRNLERVDSVAHAHSIPLLFSTPPSVIAVPGSPFLGRRAYHLGTAQDTQAYRDRLAEGMQSLVGRLAAAGHTVNYVPHQMTPDLFLDDCHLTALGNRRMAETFAAAVQPWLARATTPRTR